MLSNKAFIQSIFLFLLLQSCLNTSTTENIFPTPNRNSTSLQQDSTQDLTKAHYYDKILGALVGSAIGDAMGAPVEMWSRDQIWIQWGYVDGLLPVIREGSPEGPWGVNLSPGGTTDDTRWKYLMGQFIQDQPNNGPLNDVAFARFISYLFGKQKDAVQQLEPSDPNSLERTIRHMTWLREWAQVTEPFLDNDLKGYNHALNKFYGGEMACGGMLYAPLIGAIYPGQAQTAYMDAYELSIFDIGYAKDITGLTAAMVAQAMQDKGTIESIGQVNFRVDPMGYFESRLVGRIPYTIYKNAKSISYLAKNSISPDSIPKDLILPPNYKGDSLAFYQMNAAFTMLDEHLQTIPFHAGEIHLINLTALEFAGEDFQLAMEFIVNFGRDNDTVAAVTGTILGAYLGYSNLPQPIASEVLEVSKSVINIDLDQLAMEITNWKFN